MLRAILLVLSVCLLAFALAGVCDLGFQPTFAAIAGVALLLSLLFERYVYKPIQTEAPGAGWERTAECFEDPKSGRTISVYFNARTGQRRYVADGGA